jgi:hypothetical protein
MTANMRMNGEILAVAHKDAACLARLLDARHTPLRFVRLAHGGGGVPVSLGRAQARTQTLLGRG